MIDFDLMLEEAVFDAAHGIPTVQCVEIMESIKSKMEENGVIFYQP